MNKNTSFITRCAKAYPKKSCTKIIKWFDDNKHLAEKGMSTDFDLNSSEICIQLKSENDFFNLGKTLKKCILKFKKNFPEVDKYLGKWGIHHEIQLMKYEPGQFYSRYHCEHDGDPRHVKRVFAWMIFLNDIKIGGGTQFLYQKQIIKPKAGDFYIWPASWTHLHRGVVAPKETKFILTGWVNYI
jgi:hypothetical protein